ncbi:MAG TPA: glycosyltransferase [Methylosinus sp.]|jgi:glycosyltransferase involved in cell wall biosynthesis|uniref:glycosyltransferase n=1 Tax=Methylosinus sp. TaxID=427 RepID=UPI002F95298E
MKETEKIAIFLPNLKVGGAERISINLLNGLMRRGYVIDLILASAEGALLVDLPPKVNVVDLKAARIRNGLFPLVAYLRRARPSVVIACMWPLTIVALAARKLAGASTRVIVAEHATWSTAEEVVKSALYRWQVCASMHYAYTGANGIIAVSQGAGDDLCRFAGLDRSAVTIIYNPVVAAPEPKPAPCGPLSPTGWWTGGHRRVLAVGTLKPVKDYGTLLEAFMQLRRNVDARLLILGDGECRGALEARAESLGVKASVFMPGYVTDPSPYYEHADLHVLSSKSEALPTVIIEALAAGLPVVSTDCLSGPREILRDGELGKLVPVGDATAMAIAMSESLAAPPDRSALIARAQDFSVEQAVDAYEKMLRSARPR